MKTGRRGVSLFLGMGLWILPTVHVQGLEEGRHVPAPGFSTRAAAPFAGVDRHLLDALKASHERERRVALEAARAGLHTAGAATRTRPSTGDNPTREGGAWLAQSEHHLDLFQDEVRRELRNTLMGIILASPYGGLAAGDPTALETISNALRLLRELGRLEGGDGEALAGLQGIYWDWLMRRRRKLGLEYTALGESESAPVFDQQVLHADDGRVEVYQFTGRADHTVRWAKVRAQPLPPDLLSAEGLTVDLARERAPWLLILDGDGLIERLAGHRAWVEAIAVQARLVLLERKDPAGLALPMIGEWSAAGRWIPYLLPAVSNKGAGTVSLVRVAGARVIGRWPLEALEGPGAPALKALINRIFAAAGPR